jgi:hypothetical protein
MPGTPTASSVALGPAAVQDSAALAEVTAAALGCLAAMVARGALSRRTLLRFGPLALPLLRSSSPLVQHATCRFLEAACRSMGRADCLAFLRPLLRHAVALPPAAQASDPVALVRALWSREAQLATPLVSPASARKVPDRLNPNAGYLPEERAATAGGAGTGVIGGGAGSREDPGATVTPSQQLAAAARTDIVRVSKAVPDEGGAAPCRDLLGRALLACGAAGPAPLWSVELPYPGGTERGARGGTGAMRYVSAFRRTRSHLEARALQSLQVSSALRTSALTPGRARPGPVEASAGVLRAAPPGPPLEPSEVVGLFTAAGRREVRSSRYMSCAPFQLIV